MPRSSTLYRSGSPTSLANSDTTYHSFLDVDLHEPGMAGPGAKRCPHPTVQDTLRACASMEYRPGKAPEMKRQDSGYESISPRSPQSTSSRRPTTMSSSSQRPPTRQLVRRSPKSASISHVSRSSSSGTYHRTSYQSYQSYPPSPSYPPPESYPGPPQPHPVTGFFHFPRFAPSEHYLDETELDAAPRMSQDDSCVYPSGSNYAAGHLGEMSAPFPPQTTHYWTSDRTRRLEYAAIDAASRGVRGWVMRHIVPDCFIPKDRRRVRFEDDRGSVVRYRIELETEDGAAERDELKQGRSWWTHLRRASQ